MSRKINSNYLLIMGTFDDFSRLSNNFTVTITHPFDMNINLNNINLDSKKQQ